MQAQKDATTNRSRIFQPPVVVAFRARTRYSANRGGSPRETSIRPSRRLPQEGALGLGTTLCDTQADVPSTRRLRAQLAFKDSMVHMILQFTPSIAFCYVLHRCESRDIRCRESFFSTSGGNTRTPPVVGSVRAFLLRLFSLARAAPGVDVVPVSGETADADDAEQGVPGEGCRAFRPTRSPARFDNDSRVALLGRFRQ